jgi:hypothetical protein
MTTATDKKLAQLGEGWVKTEAGYTTEDGYEYKGAWGKCQVFKVEKTWIVKNVTNCGAVWCQWCPSFKQVVAAVKGA